MDYFSTLANLIADLAPKIRVPWLQATKEIFHVESQKTELALIDESKTDDDVITPGGKLEENRQTVGRQLKADPQQERKCKSQSKPQQNDMAPPRTRYYPVSIKKTVITPKKRKR